MGHAPKEVADYAVVARTCVEEMLGVTLPIAASETANPQNERFISELIAGRGFRQARRAAGMNRKEAKSTLERLGRSCVSAHNRAGGTRQVVGLRHLTVRALSAKARGDGEKIDPYGPLAVWSHCLIHPESRTVVRWCVGPRTSEVERFLLKETEHPAASKTSEPGSGATVSEMSDVRAPMPWFDGLDPGLARKVYAHAVATAFWFTVYNYCHVTDDSTPAMRIGWAETRWRPRHIVDLIAVH